MERNLTNLHDTDSLEDEFFLDVSPDGKHLATGGYNKTGHVLDINATSNTHVPCVFNQPGTSWKRDAPAGKLKVYNK